MSKNNQRLLFSLLLASLCIGSIACPGENLNDLLADGTIGPSGGFVSGPQQSSLVVPTGALIGAYQIEIRAAKQAPPEAQTTLSPTLEVFPEDLRFSKSIPGRLHLPIQHNQLPKGRSLWSAKGYRYDGTKWQPIPMLFDEGAGLFILLIEEAGIFTVVLGSQAPDEPPPATQEPNADAGFPENHTKTN